jgi:NAD(P)-dependent dehydrogenase (short-subunit alcohol dehydrogenase family)
MDLTNASAIVSGGAGSFGSATVRTLAQKGAKAVIADVSDKRREAPARRSAPTPSTCQLIAWTKTHVPAGATDLRRSGHQAAVTGVAVIRQRVVARPAGGDRGGQSS